MTVQTEKDQAESLVLACQQRHPNWRTELFSRLYARYKSRVLATCYRLTGNGEDARDACQEAFVNIFRSLGTFRRDASFSTWIHRIAINASIDIMRKARALSAWSLSQSPLPDGQDVVLQLMDEKATRPSEAHTQSAVRRDVRRTADLLSPKLRETVRLRYYETLSYEEIAHRLGVSIGTVKSRLFRAHNNMKAWLEPILQQHSA